MKYGMKERGHYKGEGEGSPKQDLTSAKNLRSLICEDKSLPLL